MRPPQQILPTLTTNRQYNPAKVKADKTLPWPLQTENCKLEQRRKPVINEEINQKTINVAVQTSKITAAGLKKTIEFLATKTKKNEYKPQKKIRIAIKNKKNKSTEN